MESSKYKKIIAKPVIKPNEVLPESPRKIFGNFKKEILKRKKTKTGNIIYIISLLILIFPKAKQIIAKVEKILINRVDKSPSTPSV